MPERDDKGATQAGNALANAAQGAGMESRTPTLRELAGGLESAIARALPIEMNATRFVRMVQTELQKTPKLLECTPNSFMGAVLTSAQLGLEFGPLQHAYMIPYKNHGVLEVQFQIGYKGWLALAHRSSKLQSVIAREVHENDDFYFKFGLTDKLDHTPARGDRGPVTDYYAIAKVRGGGATFEVISAQEARAWRDKYAPRKDGKVVGPWVSDFDAMAKKTVFKKLRTWLPMSPMMELASAVDEGVIVKAAEEQEPPEVEFDESNVIDAVEVKPDECTTCGVGRGSDIPCDGGKPHNFPD